ncbi:anaerobic sulfatase maturase [Candidatus Poribacteria bacterium]|nr:anaerobic sulfatase maturase [Candidatus Poribacteria bacterium]
MAIKSKASREFQIFAKPIGPICNLSCQYCYYLKKKSLYPEDELFPMSDHILENYIIQHIEASPGPVISFSWHGGEPTLLGLDYFRKIVAFQRKHRPSNKRIINGIQTNGVLLNENWCRFLSAERFAVGLSLDGPQEMHDLYRLTRDNKPTHEQAMRGYNFLRQFGIYCDILCVINEYNVKYPAQIYNFFKSIKARYISFLPLVEHQLDTKEGVREHTVPAESLGDFLCTIFDEWMENDIGKVKIQIFEEATRPALQQEHGICIFRKTCGDIPVVEHNGDFFPCDHFVDAEHRIGNIQDTNLLELLESQAQRDFGQAKWDKLPKYCHACEIRDMCNGGCPKDRFIQTPDGETGLNYLCAGYKRFFTHSKPFVDALATIWRQNNVQEQIRPSQNSPGIGRNDPCPCGSGLKYKKCCGKL